MYKIKEIYNTIQCEGFHTGRTAIFCRFAGCNLWSGREEDRSKAVCSFCDTDFFGLDGNLGGKYGSKELAHIINDLWEGKELHKFVVFTGGEPLLQLDKELIDAMHDIGFEVAVETNGTILAPEGIDWLCVSPKGNAEVIQLDADELKLVYPQMEIPPSAYTNYKASHHYLQPMDGDATEENTVKTIAYIKKNPSWKLSVQMHKYLGID